MFVVLFLSFLFLFLSCFLLFYFFFCFIFYHLFLVLMHFHSSVTIVKSVGKRKQAEYVTEFECELKFHKIWYCNQNKCIFEYGAASIILDSMYMLLHCYRYAHDFRAFLFFFSSLTFCSFFVSWAMWNDSQWIILRKLWNWSKSFSDFRFHKSRYSLSSHNRFTRLLCMCL